MTTLGARLGFWLVLMLVGAGAGAWVMWGQVQDAREAQKAAMDKLVAMGKQLQDIQAQQLRTDAILATRRSLDQKLLQQLSGLRSDLEGIYDHDQDSRDWADQCVPAAVAGRVQLPADPRCAAGKPAR